MASDLITIEPIVNIQNLIDDAKGNPDALKKKTGKEYATIEKGSTVYTG